VDVPATPQGFTNLVESYGILETIAGFGGGQDEENHWYPWFEGGPAPFAALSRPHFAMTDLAGNVYIADKNVTGPRVTEGAIFTRRHPRRRLQRRGPIGGDQPAANLPNSGSVLMARCILDTENGRVRRAQAGSWRLVPRDKRRVIGAVSAISGSRTTRSLAYFCAGQVRCSDARRRRAPWPPGF
jgi:hypothetical protein